MATGMHLLSGTILIASKDIPETLEVLERALGSMDVFLERGRFAIPEQRAAFEKKARHFRAVRAIVHILSERMKDRPNAAATYVWVLAMGRSLFEDLDAKVGAVAEILRAAPDAQALRAHRNQFVSAVAKCGMPIGSILRAHKEVDAAIKGLKGRRVPQPTVIEEVPVC